MQNVEWIDSALDGELTVRTQNVPDDTDININHKNQKLSLILHDPGTVRVASCTHCSTC